MTRVRSILRLICGFALLGLGCWLVYEVTSRFWHGFLQLDKGVATAIAGVLGTVLVSLFTLVWSKRAEQQKQIEEELRKQKSPIYEELIQFIFRFVWGAKTGGEPTSDETVVFLAGFIPKLIVWGSDEVIREFREFRKSSAIGATPKSTAITIEKVMYAIRKDLGHKNKDLKTGSLLGLFVNDIDEFLNKVDK